MSGVYGQSVGQRIRGTETVRRTFAIDTHSQTGYPPVVPLKESPCPGFASSSSASVVSSPRWLYCSGPQSSYYQHIYAAFDSEMSNEERASPASWRDRMLTPVKKYIVLAGWAYGGWGENGSEVIVHAVRGRAARRSHAAIVPITSPTAHPKPVINRRLGRVGDVARLGGSGEYNRAANAGGWATLAFIMRSIRSATTRCPLARSWSTNVIRNVISLEFGMGAKSTIRVAWRNLLINQSTDLLSRSPL
jgi:hypothetical protein